MERRLMSARVLRRTSWATALGTFSRKKSSVFELRRTINFAVARSSLTKTFSPVVRKPLSAKLYSEATNLHGPKRKIAHLSWSRCIFGVYYDKKKCVTSSSAAICFVIGYFFGSFHFGSSVREPIQGPKRMMCFADVSKKSSI
ncbi:hypothetical protein L596_000913 [Steinernema carpocapsae]|uniref:Uncharacterized protein n=1 Tax=Steinernema carpocapsae TaxID=34508 RepID=A0A4U8UKS7_STECR|nr:hypothetical protein L596_000913 [Steinernema carpocapsae]